MPAAAAGERRLGGASRAHPPLSSTVETYLRQVLDAVPGPNKALLLGHEMRAILNAFTTHSFLLENGVLHVCDIDATDRPMLPFLSCAVLARPTTDVAFALGSELADPRFESYHLFFSAMVDTELLRSIANADVHSKVQTVEEIFLDFLPVTDDAAVIPLPFAVGGVVSLSEALTSSPRRNRIPLVLSDWSSSDFTRVCQGLVATALATNRRPTIRYRGNNKVTARIAAEVAGKMRTVNTTFFDLRSRGSLLLILDRSDDPVTPLLTQWTYEAMMHEHFGIHDGIVDLRSSNSRIKSAGHSAEKDETRHVLSAAHDTFFAANRESNWGELCSSVKDLIEAYKSLHDIDLSTASMKEFQNFMDRFPEAKAQSTVMTRHATIVSCLGDEVMARSLVDLATIEQDVACNYAPNDHAKAVLEAIRTHEMIEMPVQTIPLASVEAADGGGGGGGADGGATARLERRKQFKFDLSDVLRLVMLYEMRYESSSKAAVEAAKAEMRQALQNERGASANHIALIDRYLRYAGAANRVAPLYPRHEGLLKTMVRAIGGFTGDEVQNVLTQHAPVLKSLLSHCRAGTLPYDAFPVQPVGPHTTNTAGPPQPAANPSTSASSGTAAAAVVGEVYSDIIVFIAGGATYEEALFATRVNRGEIEADAAVLQSAPKHERTASSNTTTTAGEGEGGKGWASRLGYGGGGGDHSAGGTSGGVDDKRTNILDVRVTLVSNGMVRQKDFLETLHSAAM